VFGTANQTSYSSMPVTQRFQYHMGDPDFRVKTIVNTKGYMRLQSPYWVYLKNNTMRRDTHGNFIRGKRAAGTRLPSVHQHGTTDIAALYHYKTKSVEEFSDKFCCRGDVYDVGNGRRRCENGEIKEKELSQPGHIHDDTAWKMLQKLVPKYRLR